eukprot:7391034-Prymnesium_polylepis.1
MPPDFPAGNVDNTTFPFPPPKTAQPLGRIMPVPGAIGSGALVPLGLALDLKERMKHPKTMLWMEYPASHFPWGAGEFEDVTYREIAARTAYTNCAPRSPNRQSSISNASAARLELSERFERAQVPVLRTWNLSLDRWTTHPGSHNKRYTAMRLQGHSISTVDCRHQCKPSDVMDGYARRLFGMLRRQDT